MPKTNLGRQPVLIAVGLLGIVATLDASAKTKYGSREVRRDLRS